MFSYRKIILVLGIAVLAPSAALAAQPDDLTKLENDLGVRPQAGSPADCSRAEEMCREALKIIDDSGRRKEADDLFLKALKLCPHSAQAWHGVGRWLRIKNRIPDALVAFHRAVQLDPDLTKAWWSIGTTNENEAAHPDLARLAFLRASQTHPKDLDGMVLIGQAYERLNDTKGAEAALRRAAAAFPNESRPLTDLASELASKGDHAGAEKLYAQAIAMNSKSIDGLSYTAATQFSKGNLKAAEATAKRIVNIDPKRLSAWTLLAAIEHDLGNDAEELKCSRAALAIDPDSAQAVIAMVKAETHIGDLAAADQYAKKLMTLKSGAEKAWAALAEYREAKNDWGGAEEAYKRACVSAPGDVRRWYSLALFHMRQHNWKEAEKELRTCASLPPPMIPQVWQALGLVLENQGKFSDARSAYYAALKDNPLYVPSMIGLSRTLLHLGLPAQSVEAARTATSFGQSNPSAWYTLGNVLKETGNTKDAEDAYRHSLSLQSNDPSVWN
ncbi:MAG TPA: tetratricopeptide repeat protein, partial [Trichormus sp.]